MKEFCDFAGAIRERLSKNNYQFTNTKGEYGAYRFNKYDLYRLGYSLAGYAPTGKTRQTVIPKNIFLSGKHIQDNLFREHCRKLKGYVWEHFAELIGSTIGDAPVTVSGLIAAVYLSRFDKVKMEAPDDILLADNIINKSKRNILTSYFKEFNHYDLISIK
jgi:hypothetical protein